jgi:hypothetical protein
MLIAAIAIKARSGTRDRVKARAPAMFMDDSQTRSKMRRGKRPTIPVTCQRPLVRLAEY